MKNYLCILFSILCLSGCLEDETVDITVMPPITANGENTFGCLVDGWLYVGGRYRDVYDGQVKSMNFEYVRKEKKMYVTVLVKPDREISFAILSPGKGKECIVNEIQFGEEKLEDGTVTISRFDQNKKIFSGTFTNNGRLTNGRFDVHYDNRKEPEKDKNDSGQIWSPQMK